MRKYLCILLFFFSFTLTFSQSDWFPVGAKWYYELDQYFPLIDYSLIEVIGDTMLQGKSISKLQYTHRDFSAFYGLDFIFYMYEENKKVYLYHSYSQTFNLLYDFNANPGDSWMIKNTCDSMNWPNTYDDSLLIIVDSVEYINVNGQLLKTLHLSGATTITERLISFQEFFPEGITSCRGIPEGYPYGLRCYEDSIIGLYKSTLACDSIYYAGIDDPDYLHFQIYPNPATSHISIESNIHQADLKIYDINGQKIVRIPLSATKERIDISHLSPGIYFIEVRTANKIYRQKLIKL